MNTEKVMQENLCIDASKNKNEDNKNTCISSNEKFNIKMFDYMIF